MRAGCARSHPRRSSVSAVGGIYRFDMATHTCCEAGISDRDLACAAQAGDRGAFDLLSTRYRPGIRAILLDMTRRFDVVEDLCQDALLAAWERMDTLRDPGCFGPWLRTIAANRGRMWLRRPVVEVAPEGPAEPRSEDVAATARRRELQRELSRSLALLPRQNRLALLMHALGDVPYRRIAELLGVSETTIEGRIYRARQQLRGHVMRTIDEVRPWR